MSGNQESVIAQSLQGISYLEGNIEECRRALATLQYFEVKEAFELLDVNRNKQVSVLDLVNFMLLFGVNVTEREIHLIFSDFKKGQNKLNFKEFCDFILPRDDQNLKYQALNRQQQQQQQQQIFTDLKNFFSRELEYQREVDQLRIKCNNEIGNLWDFLVKIFQAQNYISYEFLEGFMKYYGFTLSKQEFEWLRRRINRGNENSSILLNELYEYLTQRINVQLPNQQQIYNLQQPQVIQAPPIIIKQPPITTISSPVRVQQQQQQYVQPITIQEQQTPIIKVQQVQPVIQQQQYVQPISIQEQQQTPIIRVQQQQPIITTEQYSPVSVRVQQQQQYPPQQIISPIIGQQQQVVRELPGYQNYTRTELAPRVVEVRQELPREYIVKPIQQQQQIIQRRQQDPLLSSIVDKYTNNNTLANYSFKKGFDDYSVQYNRYPVPPNSQRLNNNRYGESNYDLAGVDRFGDYHPYQDDWRNSIWDRKLLPNWSYGGSQPKRLLR